MSFEILSRDDVVEVSTGPRVLCPPAKSPDPGLAERDGSLSSVASRGGLSSGSSASSEASASGLSSGLQESSDSRAKGEAAQGAFASVLAVAFCARGLVVYRATNCACAVVVAARWRLSMVTIRGLRRLYIYLGLILKNIWNESSSLFGLCINFSVNKYSFYIVFLLYLFLSVIYYRRIRT